MKIAFVNQDPGIKPARAKGAAIHLEAMRAAFRAGGHEVVAFDESSPELLGTRLASSAHRGPFDLVYERYALGATAGCRYAQLEGIPHVLEVNAPLIEEAERFRELQDGAKLRQEEAWLFAHTSLISAVSTDVAAACAAGCDDHAPIVVLPNGIDPEVFHVGQREGARGRAGLPAERFVVGFHGRLRPWHNFAALARATAGLLAAGVDAHLLCVGRGDFAAELAAATDGVFPLDRFTHREWVPYESVGALIGAFDCLPLTYGSEGPHYFSPIKLREAMAVGAVPVVPAVGDLTQTVLHGENGLVFTPGDEPGLTRELLALAGDPVRRARLGAAAAEAAGRHTWLHIANRVLDELGLAVEATGR